MRLNIKKIVYCLFSLIVFFFGTGLHENYLLALSDKDLGSLIKGTEWHDPDDEGCNTENNNPNSTGQPGKLFAVGDSLLVGMDSLGQLGKSFSEDGWSYSANGNSGRSVTGTGGGKENSGSATDVVNSSSDIATANFVLVVLGTNKSSDQDIKNFYNLIKQKNANAQIFWLSVYPDSVSYAGQANNSIAQTGAKVITNNIKPDGGDGIHYTANGYKSLVNLVASGIKNKTEASSGSVCCDSGSNIASPTDTQGNKAIIWNFFVNKGLSGPQIAGIMGNIQQESGFLPTRVQGGKSSPDPRSAGSNGWGLIQWTPGSKIFNLLKSANISTPVEDIDTQLDLIWWHMNNVSPTGRRDMYTSGGYRNIKDIAEATIAFEHLMEGAGKPVISKRIDYANKIFNEFSGSPTQSNPEAINSQNQAGTGQDCNNNNSSSGGGGRPNVDGDYKSLQEYVLNAPNLQLSEAAKGDVQRGYGSSPAPCKQSNLNINTLRLIKALLVEFPKQKFAIYTIISGHHCNAGFHPKGLGLDLNTQGDTGDTCNNKKGAERMMADVVMPFVFNNKDQLNINEMFYNADDLLNLTLNEGNVYNKKVSGHCDHIHLGVNPG